MLSKYRYLYLSICFLTFEESFAQMRTMTMTIAPPSPESSPTTPKTRASDESVKTTRATTADAKALLFGDQKKGIPPIADEELMDLLSDPDKFDKNTNWSVLGEGCKAEYLDHGAHYFTLHYKDLNGNNVTELFGNRSSPTLLTQQTILGYQFPAFKVKFDPTAYTQSQTQLLAFFKDIAYTRWPCGTPTMISKQFTTHGLIGNNLLKFFSDGKGGLACEADLGDRIRKPDACHSTPIKTRFPASVCDAMFKIARTSSSINSNTELANYTTPEINADAIASVKKSNPRSLLAYKSAREPYAEDFISPDVIKSITTYAPGTLLYELANSQKDIAETKTEILLPFLGLVATDEIISSKKEYVQFSSKFKTEVINRLRSLYDIFKEEKANAMIQIPVYNVPTYASVNSHYSSVVSGPLAAIFGDKISTAKFDCPPALEPLKLPADLSGLSTTKSTLDLGKLLNLSGLRVDYNLVSTGILPLNGPVILDRAPEIINNPNILVSNPGAIDFLPPTIQQDYTRFTAPGTISPRTNMMESSGPDNLGDVGRGLSGGF